MDNGTDQKKRTYRVLSSVHNLPTVPFIIYEVTKVIENPNASAAQLGNVISKDQGLVAKILTVANSPLYGIPRRVSTIDFAIVILGFNHIKNIVIALSMLDTLKQIGGEKFDQKNYWLHSIMTATMAKRIADDLGYSFSGEAFTAGLLHDLGIPIIFKYFKDEYDRIVDFVEKGEKTHEKAEIEILGLTHGELGKYLIDRWNLPSEIADVVFFHHRPNESENSKQLVALIHLSDFVVCKLLEGNFHWDSDFVFDEEVLKTLHLGDMTYLEGFIESYREVFNEQVDSLLITN